MYLLRFGYMDSDGIHGSRSASIMSRDGIKKYVMEFQKFVGLNQVSLKSESKFIFKVLNFSCLTFRRVILTLKR